MPDNKVTVRPGSLYQSQSDAIVIPLEANEPLPNYIMAELKEHFGISIDAEGFKNAGKLNIFEYHSDQSKRLKKTLYVIFPIIPTRSGITLKVIADMVKQVSSLSVTNRKSVAIPFPELYATQISDADAYEMMASVFRRNSAGNCELEIFVSDERQFNELQTELQKRSESTEMSKNLSKQALSEDLLQREFYIAKSYFNEVEIFDAFLRKSIWFSEITDENKNMLSTVSHGSMLFLDYSPDRNGTQINIQAVGEVTKVFPDELEVDWKVKNFMVPIKNRDYPDVPLYKVKLDYIKKELIELYMSELFNEQQRESAADLVSAISVAQSVTELNNDSDRGIDYLDIVDDVNSFARIIALKKFRPPLAIALCGQWGSGKSFFMNKMADGIDRLVSENKNGLFCSGVVHIRFNAWSYMDSNLWASMVGKIFSGLNSYISKDAAVPKVKQELRKEIQEKLSLTNGGVVQLEEEKAANEKDIIDLERQKTEIKKELTDQINKLRSKSLKSFITKADQEFKVEARVTAALEENKMATEVSDFVKKNFPQEVWGESDYLKKELSSGYIFFLEFFRKDRIVWYISIAVAILLGIWGIKAAFPAILAYLKIARFEFPANFFAGLTVFGAGFTRFLASYKHVKPLFASFWKISAQYQNELANAKFKWEQQEKAIKIDLEIKKDKIAWINEQLVEHESLKNKLQYRLDNRLNSEALSRFITEKSGADGYRKQQGIIATIREDFEVLTELFIGAGAEAKAEDESAKLDKPVERIILYIDDLDRCSEERIVEVLEAVHLLMAFELFVVVAGIDPAWVKVALKNKRVPEQGEIKGLNTAAFYLEKIFQVPFQLKPAKDELIRNMIMGLTSGIKRQIETTIPGQSIVREYSGASTGLTVSFPGQLETNQDLDAPSEPQVFDVPGSIERLLLDQQEIDMLSSFSILLPTNPRAVKRFVNTYQIIRAHDSLRFLSGREDIEQLMAIMLLLAMNIGKFRDLRGDFYHMVSEEEEGSLTSFFKMSVEDDNKQKRIEELDRQLSDVEMIKLRGIHFSIFKQYLPFVSRFSFD